MNPKIPLTGAVSDPHTWNLCVVEQFLAETDHTPCAPGSPASPGTIANETTRDSSWNRSKS